MTWFRPHSLLDTFFEGGLIIKGLTGIVEFISAIILIAVPESLANSIATSAVSILPNGFITTTILNSEHSLWTGQHTFAIAFLLVHAGVKFVIVIGLLRNHRWAYPFSIVTLAAMIAYQTYDIAHKFSILMVIITIFDVFIIWLVYREYKKLPSGSTEALVVDEATTT
ncbi:MAG: hypothetical protein JWP06_976 [Candidatus Saccharibacteria bacterium]|nr:hypothetical protein [Candidatus Saccharibacteria bacterium]